VNVGDIFRIHTTLVTPPKQKIVLYVGGSLFLWFNTEPRKERPAQMKVTAREVPGISRDCFLDCGRVTVFPERELDLGAAMRSRERKFPIASGGGDRSAGNNSCHRASKSNCNRPQKCRGELLTAGIPINLKS
jgi:hypothetical protein